jgi:uncharacterized membrane protein YheB (UPF0754 family)
VHSSAIRIISIPFISGLIGWFTNYLAVRMIFHPYQPIGFGPFKIQGLIPKRREELAISIGKTVSNHLISHADIANSLKDVPVDESFKQAIDVKIEEFINRKIFSLNLLVSMFVTAEIKTKIKTAIISEMLLMLPELAEKFASGLEARLDMQELVTDRIRSFELEKLEQIILEISSRELKAIEIYGGILGFMIGLIQVGLIVL